MTKAAILQELPNLKPEDRQNILDFLCELQDRDLLNAIQDAPAEKTLLDQELAEYRQNPGAGATWDEVQARLNRSR